MNDLEQILNKPKLKEEDIVKLLVEKRLKEFDKNILFVDYNQIRYLYHVSENGLKRLCKYRFG